MVTEKDLEQLFSKRRTKKPASKLRFPVLLISLAVLILVIINFPAFSSNFSFWFATNLQNNSYENPTIEKIVKNREPVSKIIPSVPKNSIHIDKLDLTAPVIFDVPNETKAVADNLQNGTIHIAGAAHPGEIGNVFITGHSSNYLWSKGDYSHIFSRLNSLLVNDYILVNYNDVVYFYRVSDKYVASPADIGNLGQSDTSELTLMTCYPVGTNINRLIVKAIQVKPDPATNIKKAPSSLDFLPKINR